MVHYVAPRDHTDRALHGKVIGRDQFTTNSVLTTSNSQTGGCSCSTASSAHKNF